MAGQRHRDGQRLRVVLAAVLDVLDDRRRQQPGRSRALELPTQASGSGSLRAQKVQQKVQQMLQKLNLNNLV